MMDARRRNRIIRALHLLAPAAALFLIVWALLQSGRKWYLRGGPAAVVAAAMAAVFYLWILSGIRRDDHEVDALAREAGMDPAELSEQLLPIIPRLPLAKDRGELVGGILWLVLIVLTFVAYYAGWIGP